MKANVLEDWEVWMLGLGISVSLFKHPTRNFIVECVMKANTNIPLEVVVDSWKHGTYTWFYCN